MAIVTRSNKVSLPPAPAGGKAAPIKLVKAAAAAKAPPLLPLPTTLSEVVHDLNAYSVLVHGEPGIGKTSTAMQAFTNTLLITFDPPQKSMAILQVYCPDWVTFKRYIDSLLAEAAAKGSSFPYKRIVVDGIDKAHRLCQIYTEKILGVKDVADADWGKGFGSLDKNFTEQIRRLLSLSPQPWDCGAWFISHSVWREVETRKKGPKINKLVPLMKGGADREITGLVDCIFAYQYLDKRHIMVVRGDERTYAKCRIDGHFLTPKKERIVEVPMGDSAQEGWNNLLRAFNNQQTFTHVSQGGTAATKAQPLLQSQQQRTAVAASGNGSGIVKPLVIRKRV